METRLNTNNRYMPQSQPQNSYVCLDASIRAVEENNRAIQVRISWLMFFQATWVYDPKHCPKCGALLLEPGHCIMCGLVYAPIDPEVAYKPDADTPPGYKHRNYGPDKPCACGCGKMFPVTVSNKKYATTQCRKKLEYSIRAKRHG